MCAAKSLRKAKSRLPLWGRCPPVGGGEGKAPAAPSHGLCRSAGELPSQSPSGDSSPEGRAKSRLPLWGRCPPKEGGEGNCQRPHNSVSPRRRLYQRAVHALGGVTGKLGGNLRGIEDAIKKPPARVSYGKQSTGLFSYFPALADATKTLGALPPIPPPPLKRWTKLLPAYGAHVRWPLDEHERSELPKARLAWGATPAHAS